MQQITCLPTHSNRNQACTVYKGKIKKARYLNCIPGRCAHVYNSYGKLLEVFHGSEAEIISQLNKKNYRYEG